MAKRDPKLFTLIEKLQDTFLADEKQIAEQIILVAGALFALISIDTITTPAEKTAAVTLIVTILLGLLFFVVRLVESVDNHNTIEAESFPDFHDLKRDLGIVEKVPVPFAKLERVINLIGGRRALLWLQVLGLTIGCLAIGVEVLTK